MAEELQILDGPPKVVTCSGGGISREGLHSGEGVFGRVEVGAVGRQVAQPRPRRLRSKPQENGLVFDGEFADNTMF